MTDENRERVVDIITDVISIGPALAGKLYDQFTAAGFAIIGPEGRRRMIEAEENDRISREYLEVDRKRIEELEAQLPSPEERVLLERIRAGTHVLREKPHKGIHPSHDMGEWENTIVTLVDTPRFGRVRSCKNCDAEQAETVAGKAMHDELHYSCPAQEETQG